MRVLLLLFTAFALATSFRPTSHSSPKLKCVLTSDRTEYKVGEIPQLQVKIINESNEDIYMIGSLDGSDVQWRMPYCYFTIQKPAIDTTVPRVGRCGNTNPLRAEDFVRVKPNQSFDPYQQMDGYGFFGDYESSRPEQFRNPGVYKIRFHYNSNHVTIEKFTGRWNQLGKDSTIVRELFTKATKVELTSNEIEIKIIK